MFPKHNDAVLGETRSPLATAAVLGGIDGVKQRLKTGNPAIVLKEAVIKYGDAGKNLVKSYFDCEDHSEFFTDAIACGLSPLIDKLNFFWEGSYVLHDRLDYGFPLRSRVDLINSHFWNRDFKEGAWALHPKAYANKALEKISSALQLPDSAESQALARALEIRDPSGFVLLYQLKEFQRSRESILLV